MTEKHKVRSVVEERDSRDNQQRVVPTQKLAEELLDGEDYEPQPMSAQQEQDEAVLDALRSFDAEESTAKDNSKPSFADGSPGLQKIKEDLLARGMSEEDAEAYIRTI